MIALVMAVAATIATAPPCPETHEVIFSSIMRGLLREGSVPVGSIVDAGTNTGNEACYYAAAAPERIVHAIDPVAANIDHIRATIVPHRPGIQPMLAGLSSAAVTIPAPVSDRGRHRLGHNVRLRIGSQSAQVAEQSRAERGATRSAGTVQIYRLDDLYSEHWATERAGFFHFDLEGLELDVLRGAAHIISRDRPLVSTEVDVYLSANLTAAVMTLLGDDWGYDAWLVDEVCGGRADCRNLLWIPRERNSVFRGSATLNLAAASGSLIKVVSYKALRNATLPCHMFGGCRLVERSQMLRALRSRLSTRRNSQLAERWVFAHLTNSFKTQNWPNHQGERDAGLHAVAQLAV